MAKKFKSIRRLGRAPVHGTWSCTVELGLSTEISPVNRQINTTENITLPTALAGDKNPVVLLTLGFRLTRIACKLYLQTLNLPVQNVFHCKWPLRAIKLELNCNGIINPIVTVPDRSYMYFYILYMFFVTSLTREIRLNYP